ncbi:MAG: hypothetical protein H6647_10740 [Anaerolineales bacterium]|nr:hypothetical protein [Anaerolineae bacterium]MCB9131402.1 hypothetical protein [Anaerolineales bacterium]
MPNEGPYGGKIEVRADGTVVWQAAARQFHITQKADGQLEYAIRGIDNEPPDYSSLDGKCILKVHPPEESKSNISTGAKAAILIVSGYEEPEPEADAVVLGKSYFVTGASWNQGSHSQHIMPPYDVHLHYNEDDLITAGTKIGGPIDEHELSFCYQHWISVRRVWKYYRHKPFVLLRLDRDKVEEMIRSATWGDKQLDEDRAKILVSWSRTYHHLSMFGIPSKTLDALKLPDGEWNDDAPEIWLSRWRRMTCALPTRPAHETTWIGRASLSKVPPVPVDLAHSQAEFEEHAAGEPIMIEDLSKMTLGQITKLVDDALGTPIITNDDFCAWSTEDIDAVNWENTETKIESPINGIYVTGERCKETTDPRTVIVRKIERPGTFALMYHWNLDQHEEHKRCDQLMEQNAPCSDLQTLSPFE